MGTTHDPNVGGVDMLSASIAVRLLGATVLVVAWWLAVAWALWA